MSSFQEFIWVTQHSNTIPFADFLKAVDEGALPPSTVTENLHEDANQSTVQAHSAYEGPEHDYSQGDLMEDNDLLEENASAIFSKGDSSTQLALDENDEALDYDGLIPGGVGTDDVATINEDTDFSDSEEDDNTNNEEEDSVNDDAGGKEVNGGNAKHREPSSVHEEMVSVLMEKWMNPKYAMSALAATLTFAAIGNSMDIYNLWPGLLRAVPMATGLHPSALRGLTDSQPPKDVRRMARSWMKRTGVQDCLHRKALQGNLDGFDFFFELQHLNIKDVTLDFFSNKYLRRNGPFHFEIGDCISGRQNGTRMREMGDEYMKKNPGTKDDLKVYITLYSGVSSKSQTSMYPLLIYFQQLDAFARTRTLEQSSTLLGWLPVGKLIKVENNGVPVKLSELRDSVRCKIVSLAKQMAVAELLKHIVDSHYDDTFLAPPGTGFEGKRVRLIVYSHIGDLPEVFMLLHLKQKFDMFCPFCHGFNAQCVHGDTLRHSDKDHEEDNFRDCGIDPDYCAYNQLIYTLDNNYYSIFSTDILHCLDGALTRIFDVFMSRHKPASKFVDATKRAGNDTFGCSHVSLHKSEDRLCAFQWVALALVQMELELAHEVLDFEAQGHPLPSEVASQFLRVHHDAKIACLLVQVIYFCKDDAQGLMLVEMELCMRELEDLLLVEDFSTPKLNAVTLKVHILIKHVVEHARAFGNLKNTSSASGETAHQFFWKMLRRSQNTANGLARILLDSRIALAVDEVDRTLKTENELGTPPPDVEWATPFSPKSMFRLVRSRIFNASDAEKFVLECISTAATNLNIEEIPFSFNELNVDFSNGEVKMSKSLAMGIWCTTRQVWVKSEKTASALNDKVLAYATQDASPLVGSCNNPGCLYHSGIELYCSHAHEANTAHGYPVFFYQAQEEIMAAVVWLYEEEDDGLESPRRKVFSKTTAQPRILIVPCGCLRGECEFKRFGSTIWIARKRRVREL